ncbi:MAG TPA: regulatory protein RecX [Steroidobacteraceae bacterium]|nr:regulatory protein RecX [Steroidobacteraceae bacterium]
MADPQAVRSRAIALLGRREYSRGELATTLQRKGFESQAVAEALSELAGEGLLNDERYAEALIRQLASRGQGPARIRQALQAAGLPSEQVAGALESGPDWRVLAAETRQRKFGAGIPRSWPERAKQMRFLQYRGFSSDQITGALGPADAE